MLDLAGGLAHFLFSPLPGEDSHFDAYFSDGLKPPTSDLWLILLMVQKSHSQPTWDGA